MRPSLFLVLGLATACSPDPKTDDTAPGDTGTGTAADTATDTAVVPVDADGDGADSSTDCDDVDATRHPGASEVCDEVDNDCDGDVDEEATDAPTWYVDADGDGHGDVTQPVVACRAGHGLAELSDDCDERDAFVHPGATEVCDDVDNDCDGTVDAPGLITLDGATNHGTIADALDAAQDGSTILLCDGTYAETVTLSADVTLASLHGPSTVTLDAGNVGSVVTVTGGVATLDGLTLTGGAGSLVDGRLVGGGIAVASGAMVNVRDCVVEDNLATRGAGLHLVQGAAANVNGSVFRNNVATDWGGAVMARGTFFAFDTSFQDNEASRGGAIAASYVDLSLQDVTATGNAASDFGGALYAMRGSAVRATGAVVFSGNSSARYGGAVALDDAESWTGGVLEDNDAVTNGGGVEITLSPGRSLTVSDLTVRGNTATYGAGIHVASEAADASLTLTDVIVEDNGTSGDAGVGGGLYVYRGEVSLAHVIVTRNTAATGGGVYLQGAVALDADALEVSSNAATGSAGGVGAEGGSLAFRDALLADNTAGSVGGGLYLSGAVATLGVDTAVLRNVATVAGGGAWLTGAGGRLTATGANLGAEADDNAPDDVTVSGATLLTQTGFGAGVTVTCDVDAGTCQ
ncbi:MAG: hypothetical protein RLZZ299_289 [Pseudomonadota bacterium]